MLAGASTDSKVGFVLLIQLKHLLCQQIDQPELLIPIEWNIKTNKSQVKAQVDDSASLLLIQEISSNEYNNIHPYYYCITLSISLLSRHYVPS